MKGVLPWLGETEVNGDLNSTNERSPSLVGTMGSA